MSEPRNGARGGRPVRVSPHEVSDWGTAEGAVAEARTLAAQHNYGGAVKAWEKAEEALENARAAAMSEAARMKSLMTAAEAAKRELEDVLAVTARYAAKGAPGGAQ